MNLRPIFVALLMAGGFICRSQVSLRPVTSVASSGGSAARIAVHSTEFDSLALRESPSISLADVMAYNAGVFVKIMVALHCLQSLSGARRHRIPRFCGMAYQ